MTILLLYMLLLLFLTFSALVTNPKKTTCIALRMKYISLFNILKGGFSFETTLINSPSLFVVAGSTHRTRQSDAQADYVFELWYITFNMPTS